MTLCILAAYRWTMLPDADRGHMLEDRFGFPQEVLTGRTHRCSLPFGPTSFRREVIPIGGVQKLSGGIQPMRKDFHRVDGPAGMRRFQDAAVVEGEVT